MANKYYVPGGTNTWSNTANWSDSPTLTPVNATVPTANDSVFFTSATSYTVNITASANCYNFTASAGSPVITMTATLNIAGSLDLTGSTTSWAASTSVLFFQATGATARTVNTAGTTIDCPVTATANVASTLRLLAAMTIGPTRLFTYSAGVNGDTLDLNGFTLTCGTFNSTNAITRTIAFGTTGKVVVQGTGSSWDTSTITGLTISGTPLIDFTYNGATAMVVRTGALTEASAPSVNFITGSYALTFGTSSIKNLTTTTNSSSVNFGSVTVYGNMLLSSSTTVPNSGGVITFAATSDTKTITSNTVVFGNFITFNGVGGTWQLQDDLTCPSTGTSHTVTLTNGTLDLNGKTLTTSSFSSSNSNVRVIAFGTTGIIKLNTWTTATNTNFSYTGTSNVTVDNNTATATTITPGTLTEAQALSFNIINGSYDLTITATASFKNLNFVNTGTTGFTGRLLTRTVDITIYGNLTISSNITSLVAGNGGFIFRSTSSSVPQILTSNGKTFDMPMAQNGVGGTLRLADPFVMGSTRTFNFTNGTFDGNSQAMTGATALSASGGGVTYFKGMNTSIVFNHTSSTMTLVGNNTTGKVSTINGSIDLNGYTWTATGFGTNVGTKSLTFNGGTLLLTGPYAPTFDNFNPTGFTTVAGTGTGYIRMNAAAAKTFFGNGSTLNCILSNDGAGALTIQNSNTFRGITNGVSPTSFVFTSGTTTTVSNTFTVAGTSSSSRVTIASTSAGTAATLSMTSTGTAASDYLSIKDIAVTGGATWYAGPSPSNTVSVSGNSGWTFSVSPSGATVLTLGVTEPQDTSAIGISAENRSALSAADPPDAAAIDASSFTAVGLSAAETPDAASIGVSLKIVLTLSVAEASDTATGDVYPYTRITSAATDVRDTAAASVRAYTGVDLNVTDRQDTTAASVTTFTAVDVLAAETPDTLATDIRFFTDLASNVADAVDVAFADVSVYIQVDVGATDLTDTASGSAELYIAIDVLAAEAPDVATANVQFYTAVDLSATDAPDRVLVSSFQVTQADLSVTDTPDTASGSLELFTLISVAASEAADTSSFDVLCYTNSANLAAIDSRDTAAVALEEISYANVFAIDHTDYAEFIAPFTTPVALTASDPQDSAALVAVQYLAINPVLVEAADVAAITARFDTVLDVQVTEAADSVVIIGYPYTGATFNLVGTPDTVAVLIQNAYGASFNLTEASDSATIVVKSFTSVSVVSSEAPDRAFIDLRLFELGYTPLYIAAVEASDTASIPMSVFWMVFNYNDRETIYVLEEPRTMVALPPDYFGVTYKSTLIVENDGRIMYVPKRYSSTEDFRTGALPSEPRQRAVV